jgi:hypothetical protein
MQAVASIVREPLSPVRRMRADSAQFRVALEPQALTAHRNRLAVQSNTAVGSHEVGPRTKKAGERNVGECDHLAGICGTERSTTSSPGTVRPTSKIQRLSPGASSGRSSSSARLVGDRIAAKGETSAG